MIAKPGRGGSATEAIEYELMRLVRSAEQAHRRMMAEGTAGHQLERSAYRILAYLVETGGVRLSGLADLACVDLSTASRQVAALEAQRLVIREVDPADRRAAVLRATEQGCELLRVTRQARSRFVRDVVSSWPVAEQRELGRLLARFNDGVTQSTRQEIS